VVGGVCIVPNIIEDFCHYIGFDLASLCIDILVNAIVDTCPEVLVASYVSIVMRDGMTERIKDEIVEWKSLYILRYDPKGTYDVRSILFLSMIIRRKIGYKLS
jgi:hypothetical protein